MKTSFTCNAGHYYARNAFMACHNELGTISNLRKGIYNSCNTYFAKTYKRIIDKYDSPSLGLDSFGVIILRVLVLEIILDMIYLW